ncbi:SAM-dependent methyltransferase [Rhizobium sp. BK226]|uniref:class I SAM-dependent methyltransferase n=1 Tax=Rhizobium sp. BK226 TaxID=2587075 RepID=UPI00161D8354|nr:class I SAM-dependent methyltransferase [Rhizobium sp. BK226]MBB4116325.1 SAM-dependent methyltransferase [Rhizobium sp. BK226]
MTDEDQKTICIVCGNPYRPDIAGTFRCYGCGLLYSGQRAGFGNPIQGMNGIAIRNYITVADALERAMPLRGAKILDVGCAEGGFTEMMMERGAECLGLEPDRNAAQEALEKRLPIELVSFESFAETENEYDAIVFNDVFEHMQDPDLTLQKASRMLIDDGFVLINAPVSSGFIFTVVRIAARLGITSPYRRIWAQGLSSPHIYFYSETNLRTLLAKHKLVLVDKRRLVALATDGMYERVRSTYGPLPAFIISALASLFTLVSGLFPGDVMYLLFKNEK